MYTYFVKKVGLFNWEIWMKGPVDPANGATEWKVVWGVRFYRYWSARKVAHHFQSVNETAVYIGESKYDELLKASRELSDVISPSSGPYLRKAALAVKEALRHHDELVEKQYLKEDANED